MILRQLIDKIAHEIERMVKVIHVYLQQVFDQYFLSWVDYELLIEQLCIEASLLILAEFAECPGYVLNYQVDGLLDILQLLVFLRFGLASFRFWSQQLWSISLQKVDLFFDVRNVLVNDLQRRHVIPPVLDLDLDEILVVVCLFCEKLRLIQCLFVLSARLYDRLNRILAEVQASSCSGPLRLRENQILHLVDFAELDVACD